MVLGYSLSLVKALVGHRLRGSPVPPPHAVKVHWLQRFQRQYRADAFVETGTYYGASVDAMLRLCSNVYTIELDPELWARAQRRFQKHPHVHVILGNSGRVLMELLPKLTGRCLFWLDGHYSGAGTARGAEGNTPVRDELAAIGSLSRRDHVILIDDARLFDGSAEYPSLERLRQSLLQINPDFSIRVVDDIVQAYPPQRRPSPRR